MGLLDTARQHGRQLVAGAVAAGLAFVVPVPVAADEPSPTPSAAMGPTPADVVGSEVGGRRRPAQEDTTGDLVLRNGRFRTHPAPQ